MVGHTGAGKSTLVAQMVAAVVQAGSFLDWPGAGGKALILDLEQGERSAKRMLRDAGLAESDHVDIALIADGLVLDRESEQVAAVERLLEHGGYDVVSLDPWYKAYLGNSSDEEAVKPLLLQLDAWRARYGFALVLPAHPRKPPTGLSPPLTIHDVAGSGAIVRGAEVVLAIEYVSPGYSRLRFLKDREGVLPVGEKLGLPSIATRAGTGVTRTMRSIATCASSSSSLVRTTSGGR